LNKTKAVAYTIHICSYEI